jgi:hypothetical protein
MLLPGSSTPFVRLHGIAVVYFGLGRALYFGAPVLIGWGLVLIAVRRRLSAAWLAPSLMLLAWVASAIRVQATISPASRGGGDIGITFAFRDPAGPAACGDDSAADAAALFRAARVACSCPNGVSATVIR